MARVEEERIKLLGYDSKMEVQQDTPSNSSQSPLDIQQPPSTANTASPSFNVTSTTDNPQDIERLGLGFKRLGFGQSSASAPPTSTSAKHSTDDAPTTARERFGNQKAISSDMYFERNAYDPDAQAEAQSRLANFSNATSISSNQYFGRDEAEVTTEGELGSMGSFTGNESLSALEAATREAISRVLSNPDVQNAADSIRAGALKLSDYLANMNEQR